MKYFIHTTHKGKRLLLSFALLAGLSHVASAQLMPGFLSGQATIGADLTFLTGNVIVGNSGELFLGTNTPALRQTHTLFLSGNYEGRIGARMYHSVIDNSNEYGARGFFDIEGTANGSTEIVLDMFNAWDGSRIDLVRAYSEGSAIDAFTMQEAVYNGLSTQLQNRIEGDRRIWFIEAQPIADCLPVLIQKRNHTIVVNNHKETNGGYTFVSYEWYKNSVLQAGETWGDYFNETGLDTSANYHAIVIDTEGITHQTCPLHPVFLTDFRVSVYPVPLQTKEYVNVKLEGLNWDETEIMVYDAAGSLKNYGRATGEITPVEVPNVPGTYVIKIKSGTLMIEKTIMRN